MTKQTELYTPYEAFFKHWVTNEPAKLIDLEDYIRNEHTLTKGLSISIVDGNIALTITYGDLTFILPNVNLSITNEPQKHYAIKGQTLDFISIYSTGYHKYPDDMALVINVFGSEIAFDCWHTTEKVAPLTYEIRSTPNIDIRNRTFKCNFTKLTATYYEQTTFE